METAVEGPAPRAVTPLDEQRKRVFLETLRQSGSMAAACRAASPHSNGKRLSYTTFRDEMRRNPAFAQEVEEARQDCLGRIEALLVERAESTLRRPVVSQGAVIAFEERHDNQLLLRVAERLSPEWAPRKNVAAHVTHERSGGPQMRLEISPGDLKLLPAPEAEQLCALLGRLADLKDAAEAKPAEVQQIE